MEPVIAEEDKAKLEANFDKRKQLVEASQIPVNFIPLYDRVLLKRLSEDERTASGLWIPEKAVTKQQWGLVVEVGCGRLNPDGSIAKMQVKKGYFVLFEQYGGEDIEIDKQSFLIIKEPSILGVKW